MHEDEIERSKTLDKSQIPYLQCKLLTSKFQARFGSVRFNGGHSRKVDKSQSRRLSPFLSFRSVNLFHYFTFYHFPSKQTEPNKYRTNTISHRTPNQLHRC
ncbi:hypothetical protein HS088_TW13G01648 [Tripterygium wilfordii]|uniref:Uncharacterized protein n=1 Tax=Tripterygium wilfordii TaxID=458696 RepID=A0A7J7CXB0_TRIWF|nr:hypothetical protein HS088_TW13G01648 [Tripterygium wilfordii]